MIQDELDRILISDEEIEPSATFSGAVMDRIRTKEKPFPWIPFLLLVAVVTIASVAFFPSRAVLEGENAIFQFVIRLSAAPMDEALSSALLFTALSLSGTLFLVWVSFRLTGSGR